MTKDRIFNIRVSEKEYVKLKRLGSIRAREILLQSVDNELFHEVPETEMERLIYKYDALDSVLTKLKEKHGTIDQKALAKLTDNRYEQLALNNFEDLFQRVSRSLTNLHKERLQLLKLRRTGERYVYKGLRELAVKNGLTELLDRPDVEIYKELASRQLIDDKEKYKANIGELVKGVQDKIRKQELLLDSLREMSPYIIMRENVQSQIDSVREQMKDLLYVIEHLKALEDQYAKNFLQSLKFSEEHQQAAAAEILDNKEYTEKYCRSDISLYDKFEKYLACCGIDEARARAIVKRYMA